jgi:hypothetical protein
MAGRADSTGRRNTFNQEVFMGRPAGWMKQLPGQCRHGELLRDAQVGILLSQQI